MPRDLYGNHECKELDTSYGKAGCRTGKVLIVDDDEISCNVLCRILKEQYHTLVAVNGKEALEILNAEKGGISLVLLDLMMPVMDGYEFLDLMRKDARLSAIPVIVTTAKDQEEDEIRCLENGAADFVSKPYRPEVVKRRVDRLIRLWETTTMIEEKERDRLTGLYSREAFYLETARILEKNPCVAYDLVVANVENFKVVNERLGVTIGDKTLCYMADRYRRIVGEKGICTRLHGDVFAMLIAHGDGSWRESLLWQWDEEVSGIPLRNLVIKYGIYENVDRRIPPFGMCDRAILAMNKIRNRYGRYVSIYEDSLSTTLLKEQKILDTMERALVEHQFEVYYQPKYDLIGDCVSGAEALVRWVHPEFGFMSPGEFIPLFEKNGFITKLDFYVWEEVCKSLRKWKDEGRRPIPVSVNISRMDFSVPDLSEEIIGLADRYGIDRETLHLEVTESVYMDEPQRIVETVTRLRESGFKIEMDDFGTGYSSLNMLSEMPIDFLKLDIKFIQKNSENRKNILGFIISLAKWLNLETIAEGVENIDQVEKLKSFGCDYVQGYYFAKPMQREAFERYLEKVSWRERATVDEGKGIREVFTDISVGKNRKLLLVEDSDMNREILKAMLEPYYYLEEAADGEAAYRYLMSHPGEISLILLDLVMPVMDGFQFMKLREQEKNISNIQVIITSETETDSALMALKLGAEYFVGKPYRKELLLLSIRNALRRGSERDNRN